MAAGGPPPILRPHAARAPSRPDLCRAARTSPQLWVLEYPLWGDAEGSRVPEWGVGVQTPELGVVQPRASKEGLECLPGAGHHPPPQPWRGLIPSRPLSNPTRRSGEGEDPRGRRTLRIRSSCIESRLPLAEWGVGCRALGYSVFVRWWELGSGEFSFARSCSRDFMFSVRDVVDVHACCYSPSRLLY